MERRARTWSEGRDPRDPRPFWWENYVQYIERVLGISPPSRPPGIYAEYPFDHRPFEPSWVVNSYIQAAAEGSPPPRPRFLAPLQIETSVGERW